MRDQRNLSRIIGYLAAVMVCMGVLVPPLVYVSLRYIHISSSLAIESRFMAAEISRVVSLNPEMWQFEEVRLESYLTNSPGVDIPETRRVVHLSGEVAAEHGFPLKWPVIMRLAPLMDSGQRIGRVEVLGSFRPVLIEGAGVLLVSLSAGLLILGFLSWMPLRVLSDAEQAHRKSEEINRMLIESANDAIIIIDASIGRVVDANHRAEEMLGMPHREIVGKQPSDLHPSEDASLCEEVCLYRAPDGGVSSHSEMRLLRADGTLVPVEVSTSSIEVKGQRLIQNIYRDITERKWAIQEIREAGQRMENIMERSPLGILLINVPWTIDFANPAVSYITGLARDQLIGQLITELPFFPELKMESLLRRADEGDPFQFGPTEFHRPDGQRMFGRFTGIPFLDAERNKVILFIEDVTELIEAEKERQNLNALLLQSQKMESLGTLVSGIAHNFNNILLASIGLADAAMETLPAGHPAREYLEEAVEAGERGADLIGSLMTFSHQQDFELRQVPLDSLVGEACQLMGHVLPRVITMSIIHEVPTPLVNADPLQMEQVLMNLLSNARDAMPEGGFLDIRTFSVPGDAQDQQYRDSPPGDWAVIEVSDTGIGIPQELVERIFDPFFTTKGQGRGTGLGLATAYGIVRQHNGEIRVTSHPGGGSVFRVYLPILGMLPSGAPPAPGGREERALGSPGRDSEKK